MKIRVQAEYQKEVSAVKRDSGSSDKCSFSFVTSYFQNKVLKKQLMKQTSKSSRLEVEVLWQLFTENKIQHLPVLAKWKPWMRSVVFRSTASKWRFKTSEDSTSRTMSNYPAISRSSLKSSQSSSKRWPTSLETNRSHFLKLQHNKSEGIGDNRWTDSGRRKQKPSRTRTRWSSSVSTRSQTWWRWWKSTRSAQHSHADVIHPNIVVATSAVAFLSFRASTTGSSKKRTRSSARTRRERRRLLHTFSRWYDAERPWTALIQWLLLHFTTFTRHFITRWKIWTSINRTATSWSSS